MSRQDELARPYRETYRRTEAPALRAIEYFKTAKYAEDNEKLINKLADLLGTGIRTESEALQLIGRMQQLLEDWRVPHNIVKEFDSARESLAKMFPPEQKK